MQTLIYEQDRLMNRHRGTMPVILTCPHDGTVKIQSFDVRKSESTPARIAQGLSVRFLARGR
ncbi:hypothetical protein SAMN05421863_100557 [Nitrosomonas communis]|uniref:Uncharacterized protein n=1 Tax=Nitrosomonas communis TaxID=44574 RepID=A0A1I4KXJ8_9PROT|nr:hypothetical protein SAMN05421863_100557 [Nitrosomonas communis]